MVLPAALMKMLSISKIRYKNRILEFLKSPITAIEILNYRVDKLTHEHNLKIKYIFQFIHKNNKYNKPVLVNLKINNKR